ncbi:GNAT family N-acetyltransferase [Peribacillus cavernae]|uniref:GNAT family N-acetyltransferase n=1 Tax=Peribacillus cavernae TaxID=1674310 RepID=A0A3S0TWK1_9BACI|nr:GNAT family N-acetyltransferase [Peribacillus cavernae]MDQ0219785.1 GNAT superfamily N-acetyltransferase [Peribacillus cavernae]RUQ25198.1 GNAT family N-acetyltransferase [Peribacillus cavernae]
MISLQDVLMLDFAYLETFTKRIETTWGSILCNESQPNYYDANHAHISDTCDHPQVVIDEVISYYQSRNIIPRFYIYNLEIQQNIISELKSKNFRYEELISPVQLWNNRVIEIVNNNRITIEKVTPENYQEALDIESSIKEFGGKETIEKVYKAQFNHHSFTHYLLRYDGIACSTACIFENGIQARLESVATMEEFRGKGLIGEVIQFIQKEVMNRGIKKLWVFPINESVEKVYQKYGFQTVGKLKNGHAFLGGKSIKEIRG